MNRFSKKTVETINIKTISIAIFAAMLLTNIAILFRDFEPAITTPVILLGIIFIPGLLLAICLQLHPGIKIDLLLYMLGLGIAFWLADGLLINQVLPLLGVKEPLRLIPILVSFDTATIFLLLLIKFLKYPYNIAFKESPFNKIEKILSLIAPMFIALSLAGTMLLNNNSDTGSILIMLLIALIALYFMALAIVKQPIRDGVYIWGILCSSFALLLMYSMRSSHVLGWDINSEYQVFQLTFGSGHWNPNNLIGNAEYNTCLSITILPTILANLLPVSPEYIFKFIFQIFFSFLPAIVFIFSKRYFPSKASVLSSFVFMSQTWFYEQMPALIRQEIALIFFGLALLAIFDISLKRRQQIILFLSFSFALVLSHYSTSYIWLVMFALELITFNLLRFAFPYLNKATKQLNAGLFFALLIFVFLWESVFTSTGNSFFAFIEKVPGHFAEAFSYQAINEDLSLLYFKNSNPNTEAKLIDKYAEVTEIYHSDSLDLYPDSTYAGYVPKIVNDKIFWPSLVSKPLGDFVLLFSKIIKFMIIIVFTAIGICFFLRAFYKERKINAPEFVILCLTAIPLILAILFLPIFHVSYNITRLFMQAFIILSTMTVMGGIITFGSLVKQKMAIVLLSISLCLLFLYSTGFTDRIIGGESRITLNHPKGAFDSFYIYDTEAASAKWLNDNCNRNLPIYADPLAKLRLHSFTQVSNNVDMNIFPSSIIKDSYLYMSYFNVRNGIAYTETADGIVSYEFPTKFVEDNKDLIYNDGDSKIYR